MSRRLPPRAAFSLVELLVVIAIVLVLMGLLLSGVQNVRDSTLRMETLDRIMQIQTAISLAKSKGGMDYVWPYDVFYLKKSYANTDPELDLLKRMFPNMRLDDNGLLPQFHNTILDRNQALLFLLTGGAPTDFSGFSNNPAQPFLRPTPSEQRKGPWLQIRTDMIWQSSTNPHPYLVDAYRRGETGRGTPFIVFAEHKTIRYSGQSVSPANFPIPGSVLAPVLPYQSVGKYINENGVQIISAGKDRIFGTTGQLPATDPYGRDDLANFSRTSLGTK
ncbi:MAG: type II secretion system protein [Thermogemmata sp.]